MLGLTKTVLHSNQEKGDSLAGGQEPSVGEREQLIMLCFSLQGRWFGLDANTTKEVVGLQKVTTVPGAAPHILGVISLHGRAVAVLDLCRFFELPRNERDRAQELEDKIARTLVLHVDEMTVGVVTDEVDRIVELEAGQLRASQVHHEGRLADFVTGEFDLNDRIVTVVDPFKFVKQARV